MADNPHSFANLSDDVLNKEAPADFFDTPSLQKHLRDLRQYVNEGHRTPIFITGPAGFGKSRLIKRFLQWGLPPYGRLEWVNLANTPDPHAKVEQFILRLSRETFTNPLWVVLDSVESFSQRQLQSIVDRLFNYKKVTDILVTTRHARITVRGARQIHIGPPEGKLYGLKDQLVSPQKKIIALVAPQIVTANDLLIEKLKRSPADLFKISPRQFEELIADLLTDMDMEVELTPATRDGGKDILAYMKTEIGKFLCLVEAKRYNKERPVGVSLVRSLFGTLADHQATSGMLVTTSRFAKPAKEFQERHKYQLELKDYGDVVSWILKYKQTPK